MTTPRRPARPAKEATVTAVEQLSPELVRLSFHSPELIGQELPHSDHYIKLLFVPEGADYAWPFDTQQIREEQPRELQPVTRTYTFRRVDSATGNFDVDFVIHGDQGLAGPWGANAQVGDTIGFMGPGGAWHPEEGFEHFIFAGDEAAAPAIAAGIEALPKGATATAYVEVAGEGSTFEMPEPEGVKLQWVYRNGATHGTALSKAVRDGGIPTARTSWFIHGVAEMIKELRAFLFVNGGVEKSDVSISGYWRIGMTEDQWQASKPEFNAEVEAAESAATK